MRNRGNKYNGVDIGKNASGNNRENIDMDSGASNNFENKIYKLIFKVIKLQNQKRIINILYRLNYK